MTSPITSPKRGITPIRMPFTQAGGSVSSPFMRSGRFSGFGPLHITRCTAIAEGHGKKPIKNYNNNEYASGRSTSDSCLMRTITNDYRDAQILSLGSTGDKGPYL